MKYNREVHSETSQAPFARWLDGPTVGRESPTVDDLRLAFTDGKTRSQRTSDGTASIEGARFEIPSRFRHLRKLHLRYASWDLTHVWLVDERTGAVLSRLYPLDKARNADGFRGVTRPAAPEPLTEPVGIAPLLRKLMTEYAATGLPPAYIPRRRNDSQALGPLRPQVESLHRRLPRRSFVDTAQPRTLPLANGTAGA